LKVEVICNFCKKPFYRETKEVNRSLKNDIPSYCSHSCSAKANNIKREPKKKTIKLCKNCNKPLIRRDNTYCNLRCFQDFLYKDYIKKWKSGEVSGLNNGGWYSVSNYIRRYLFEKYDNKCSKCGWSVVNTYTNLRPLEVEHIDGNYLNNVEENLDLLCPNCHSLTETYRGANRGKGRPISWRKLWVRVRLPQVHQNQNIII
jgi:hypothetical protein